MWTGLVVAMAVAFVGLSASTSLAQSAGDAEMTLASWGAGDITIGSTLADLTGLDVTPGPAIDDATDSYTIRRDGEIIALVATSGDDAAPINLIVALDSMFRTAEGVGPGSSVAEVEAAYGTAILSFTDPKGAELLSVSSGPQALHFFTSYSGGPQAGIYDGDTTATTEYEADAVIAAVWVDCRFVTCPGPASSVEPRDEPAPSAETAGGQEESLAVTGVSKRGAGIGLLLLGVGFSTLGTRNAQRRAARHAIGR